MSALTIPAPASERRAATSSRIPTLDGWRGIAILLVLAGHFAPANAPADVHALGQHGVAIFFVLSGFLITTLLCAEREKRGTIDLRRFYLRRAFRLLPCAWSYLAAVMLLTATMHPRPYHPAEIFGSLFFFRNYVGTLGLTGHFWSLSLEEQFYLVWPATLLLLGNRRAQWLALAVAGFVTAWRLQQWSWTDHSGTARSLATQYRADAILLGCALALLLPRLKPHLRAWMALPLLAGVAACAVSYTDMVPLRESILIALLLAVTSQCPMRLNRWLDWKPLALLGAVSYSTYVWQQPFWMVRPQSVAGMLAALAGVAIASLLSYRLIEQPAIAFGKKLL